MQQLRLSQVKAEDVEPIAIGAGILGTGGGGDPYLESVYLRRLLQQGGPQPILNPEQLDDEGTVAVVGYIGAPTVSVERIIEGSELVRAVRLLEAHIGRKVDAIGIAEIGGGNSLGPLIAALQAGVAAVDADGMGRAFPEVQMTSYLFRGDVTVAPFAMVDAGENAVVIPDTVSAVWAERLARNLAVSMGASAGLAGLVMNGKQFRETCIPNTLSLAHHVGSRVLAARKAGEDVPAAIAGSLNGRILFRGKIVDVNRRTTRGFARGNLSLQGHGDSADALCIEFQNEYLIAYHNDEVVLTVPDLICIVTEDTVQPVATELLRYGMRVAVLGVPCADALSTQEALKIVGPRAFGYEVDYEPLGRPTKRSC